MSSNDYRSAYFPPFSFSARPAGKKTGFGVLCAECLLNDLVDEAGVPVC